ncbi:MAG TPA: acetate/propionate family kinase [Rhizobiales bacterium]|nr:acetate/propionate family kinase [Hyphomicrobiales bacterium]
MKSDSAILVINCGSSSVKFALFAGEGDAQRRLVSGALERLGLPEARFRARDEDRNILIDETHDIPNHVSALDLLLSRVETLGPHYQIQAVGHRVVHGGDDCDCPLPVTPALEARLRKLIPLAPLHLPHNLAGIMAVRVRRPDLLQVACFDTAFHKGLPRLARLTGLPRRFEKEGIRRYGFHGLSYEYVMGELRRRHGSAVAGERIIVAHLGNGAWMAAIEGGRSVDTSMGFSTLGGLLMGTRSGDLDPGIVLHLLMEKGMTAEQVMHLLYEQSGLLGISGLSRNMKELLAQSDMVAAAAEAVDFFCYQARKHLAALTASLGGLDRLVFTGGIGANASEIRTGICEGLGYLGIVLDGTRNAAGKQTISGSGSEVVVEAFPTDEEQVIARGVLHFLGAQLMVREA